MYEERMISIFWVKSHWSWKNV